MTRWRPPELPQGGPDAGGLTPARVLCSQVSGGFSDAPYGANNLGLHVGDDPLIVAKNRRQLIENKEIDAVQWLDQVHGVTVVDVDELWAQDSTTTRTPTADAQFTTRPGCALAILTADCLPVLLADVRGEVVAAAHAGWRGLCAGVLEALIARLPVAAMRLQAFIGPAIGADAFEVGPEVVEAFVARQLNAPGIIVPANADRHKINLALAARVELQRLGVSAVHGGGWCTYEDQRFYSWRRETHRAERSGEVPATGRQASLVWLPKA